MAVVSLAMKFPAASWEEAEAFVRRITDRMGCSIDEGIVDVVVALNLLGFPTCQSCEGHINDGLPYPWVDFETDEFPTFRQALKDASCAELSADEREAKGAQLVMEACALSTRGVLYARLEELLSSYYREHPTIPEEWRLVIHWSPPILFRLMPWCGYEAHDWDDATRAHQLPHIQVEMQTFAAFLKQLWQRKKDKLVVAFSSDKC